MCPTTIEATHLFHRNIHWMSSTSNHKRSFMVYVICCITILALYSTYQCILITVQSSVNVQVNTLCGCTNEYLLALFYENVETENSGNKWTELRQNLLIYYPSGSHWLVNFQNAFFILPNLLFLCVCVSACACIKKKEGRLWTEPVVICLFDCKQ